MTWSHGSREWRSKGLSTWGGGGARRGSEATESWGGSRYIGRFLKIVYQIAISVYIKCHYEG